MSDVALGFAQAIQYTSLIATALGVLLGLVVGMIPGLTISSGIIIVLPLTFALPPDISIALLLGLYVAGMTGGSFSAVLLNIPGTPSASATALDGFPLSKRGERGRALGVAIVASFLGGLFSFGTRPNAFGGWEITQVDKPIFLPGHLTHYVKVMPGDFIFGDNDGVQLIPKALVDEVLLRVEKTFEKENEERKALADGMPIDEVYRVFGVL